MLNSEEKNFYSRQIKLDDIGEKGQEKLKSSRVLIVGAGGLGCSVLSQLTGCGVGNITLIDGDVISVSNLSRQPLYSHDDIGKQKVQVAKEFSLQRNPWLNLECHFDYLTPGLALSLFPEIDLVVDCTDNFPTRYLINDACVHFNIPFVYGGIDRDMIQWAVFNYHNGPTYRCLHPEEPLSSFIKSCDDRGVLGVTPAILGSIQARETLKVILGNKELEEFRFHLLNTLDWDHQAFKAKRKGEYKDQKIKSAYGGWCNTELVKEIEIESLVNGKSSTSDILIDVREPEEFKEFHLENAINIPLASLKKRIEEIGVDSRVILYCKTGQRSLTAGEILKELGLKNVFSLKYGVEKKLLSL
jgi:sulfur-carrier protein adenylyltransferase/sulfurtransferase